MCLIVFAWRCHCACPLIVAANRDEFHARPTAAAHWWHNPSGLLAGQDLEADGTWMGLSRSGRFAALTNYRDPSHQPVAAPSRGLLVRDSLLSEAGTQAMLEQVASISANYAPFNLLIGDGETLGLHESVTGTTRLLAPGIYGLSNHALDTPWPKLLRARQRFAQAMTHLPDTDALFELLHDETPAPDVELPHTGVSLEWERRLSPVFIRSPDYGTRCSTVLTFNTDGSAALHERSWDRDGNPSGEQSHCFHIEKAV